jgi:hypothetical protein
MFVARNVRNTELHCVGGMQIFSLLNLNGEFSVYLMTRQRLILYSSSSAVVRNGETIPPLHHTSSWSGAYLSSGGDVTFTFYRGMV